MNYKEQIRQFIVQNFLFGDGSQITDTTSFLEKAIIDSTGVLEVIGFLEKTYGIRILDEEILPENLDSLENIDRFVGKKMEAMQAKA
jgi:acyl carrier protein